MSNLACDNLEPNGLPPSQFINPNIIPKSTIDALSQQSKRIYGCVNFLNSPSVTNTGLWWCATKTPNQEIASTGRSAFCPVNTKEQICMAPWLWTQQPSANSTGLTAYVTGCTTLDSTSSFSCNTSSSSSSSVQVCSPAGLNANAPANEGSALPGSSPPGPTTVIIIVVVIVVIVLLMAGAGFIVWRRRNRSHSGSEDDSHKVLSVSTDNTANNAGPPSQTKSAEDLGTENNVMIMAQATPVTVNHTRYPSSSSFPNSTSSPNTLTNQGATPSAAENRVESPFLLHSRHSVQSSSSVPISFLPPRASSSDLALPSMQRHSVDSLRLSSSAGLVTGRLSLSAVSVTSSESSERYSTEDEMFPRPYRTYVNMESTAPVVQAESNGKRIIVPTLPATLGTIQREGRSIPPNESIAFHGFDFKLSLTANLRTKRGSELCMSKGHLPGYAIDDLVATYEQIQGSLRDLVMHSFAIAPEFANQDRNSMAHQIFNSVTGDETPFPPSAPIPAGEPNQAAFLSRVLQVMLTDLFIALANPIQVSNYVTMFRKVIPEMKKDLKIPTPKKSNAEDTSNVGLSAHLIFVLLDHLMSSPSLSTSLLEFLRPILTHARTTIADTFHAHGIPTPRDDVLDDFLHTAMDWFFRIKREYPGVGFYYPKENTMVDPEFSIVEGGGVSNNASGLVAFATCFGLWDGSIGSVGYLARVWAKPNTLPVQ